GRVIIVGGGDVAIDAARVAVRLGAAKVSIFYRRTRREMPARENEVEDALAEGVEIRYLTAPQQVLTKDREVIGLQCIQMQLGEPDSSGRRRPIPIPGSEFVEEADLIIPAIGQTPESSFLLDSGGVNLTRWGTIESDPVTFATSREGVFAGGDAQTGPWVAIGAVSHGREAAISISRYIKGEDIAAGREKPECPQETFRPVPAGVEQTPRAQMATIPMSERIKTMREVELGLTEEQALAEARKCLDCMVCCECLQCVDACIANAVIHDDQPRVKEIEVGAVIMAPGFEPFDPTAYDTYSYSRYPNVVTAMEFERLLSASGPTEGHLVRPSDHKEPQRIAWLQCVGSRDINRCDNSYCSSVCCMYAIKEAMVAKEHSNNSLDTAIFLMDMRTHRKDFEKSYMRARFELGIRFIRSRVHTIDEVPGTHDLIIPYADESGELREEVFDMVVLSVGISMNRDVVEMAQRIGVELDSNRFVKSGAFTPVETSRKGIYACGAFTGPKDIPYSVMEASAAACAATENLAASRHTQTRVIESPPERDVSREPPRIGVFVCNCGVNIGGVVNVPEVVEYARTLPHVVYVEDNLFSCSQDTQDRMTGIIREKSLNRVVVAACTPRTHEEIFQQTLINAGLNKYLFEMANIRNHDSWVHSHDPNAATLKAKDMVRMAVAKSALLSPLQQTGLTVNRAGLIVGGGVSGMSAALAMANQGYPVHLVEASDSLGGNAKKLYKVYTGERVSPFLEEIVGSVSTNKLITVHLNSRIVNVEGFVGNFKTTIQNASSVETLEHGVTILATGATEHKPKEYLYGEHPAVLTHFELDALFQKDDPRLTRLDTVAFIQCVGSRNDSRPYCSKVCCTHTVKSALELKERNPHVNVFVLYRDIRTYGTREELYQEARRKGVIFVRCPLVDLPVATPNGDRVRVEFNDHVLRRKVAIDVDMLCLATAIESHKDFSLAQFYKVPMDEDGWFLEAHQKLRPVDFATDGVFMCGMSHYPKPLEQSIAQARAAASRAMGVLAKDSIEVGGIVSTIDPSLCSGCLACLGVCPYGAITFDEERKVAVVAEVLCKGCGACAAACPSEAPSLMGFSHKQMYAQIKSILAA
ncbi:MAG: FAD-dependent oxidoreductase, partial [Deltaproteobacteria bacterium]|nr:FAD-dependent oxidoreductase [Deltaproteobacteria bacterium]